MKNVSKLGMMLVLAISLFLSSCSGSYYVADQPLEPVYERPVAPYDGAIWIDGDWGWDGSRYAYVQGHWERPRSGRVWTRGSWEHNNRGYRWHKGGWR